MAEHRDEDLSGSHFERVLLNGSRFRAVDLSGSSFRATDFHDVVMSGVQFLRVRIDGEFESLVLNGVDVAPIVAAEVARRDPEQAKMHPSDPAGFREAWDLVERRWGETVERARGLDPLFLHESVGGEWSFIETLRHLLFATDAWVGRAVLGDPSPWHRLDLPPDEIGEIPGVPADRAARPSLEEVLALRADRMETVRRLIESLTDESLAAETEPVAGDSWPPSQSFPVRKCLLVVLREEWHHRLFAERDIEVLTGKVAGSG